MYINFRYKLSAQQKLRRTPWGARSFLVRSILIVLHLHSDKDAVRCSPTSSHNNLSIKIQGRLAQLVEQSVYTGKVRGSSPLSPTVYMFLEGRIFSEELKSDTSGEAIPEYVHRILENVSQLLDQPESFLGEGMTAKVHIFPDSPRYCVKIVTPQTKKPEYEHRSLVVSIAEEAGLLSEVSVLNPEHGKVGVRVPQLIGTFKTKTSQGEVCEVLIMERMHAVSLKDVLENGVKLPESFELELFFEQLGSFIKKMHDIQVYHRDLHEGNVMIDVETGLPVVIDFGLGYKAIRSEGEGNIYKIIRINKIINFSNDDKQVIKLQTDMRNFLTK